MKTGRHTWGMMKKTLSRRTAFRWPKHWSVLLLSLTLAAPGLADSEVGLKGDYFNDPELVQLQFTRVDPVISFNWEAAPPDPRITSEFFSVRWTGQVVARSSETCTLQVVTEARVRLWLNGLLILNRAANAPPGDGSQPITMYAGQAYDITLECTRIGNMPKVELYWSSPSQVWEVIPVEYLRTGPPPPPGPASIERQGDDFVVAWPEEDGSLLRVQHATRLDDPDWVDLPHSTSFDGESFVAEVDTADPSGFYRLALPLRMRAVFPKPSPTVDPDRAYPGQLVVKFHEGTRIRLREEELKMDLAAQTAREMALMNRFSLTHAIVDQDLQLLHNRLNEYPQVKLARLFDEMTEEALADLKAKGEANVAVELADMDLYYYLLQDDPPDLSVSEDLLELLLAMPSVETAYAQPRSQNADLPPVTTLVLEGSQGYLNPAPTGINARYAKMYEGGGGTGTRVIDVEANWKLDHEDLPGREFYGNGIPWGDDDHGTAVLGVMVGVENEYGITGIVPNAQYGVGSIVTLHASSGFGGAYGIAAAVLNAISALRPGDVLLIEQHIPGLATGLTDPCRPPPLTRGEQFEFVPVEFQQAEFDAISAATARGIVVVEAAGNGSMNLDSPIYANRFSRTTRDSGAIMVGASNGSGSLVPACFSNFGSRLDVHGWGAGVATLGYGMYRANGPDRTQWYTTGFAGTSSASPIVAGAACALQGIRRARGETPLSPGAMRGLLRATGTPQASSPAQIGPLPDLRRAIHAILPQAADYGSQVVPTTMVRGETTMVSVTMTNVGRTTWTAAGEYALRSQNPLDNRTWGLHRVPVPATVAPGDTVTFEFPITAPSTDGAYQFQWRMNQEGVEQFGDLTPNTTIIVGEPARWTSLGGAIASDPAVGMHRDRRLEVFARGTDNNLRHIGQTSPGGSYSSWQALPGMLFQGNFDVGRNRDDRIEIFGRRTDNAYAHIWQHDPNGSSFSDWNSFGETLAGDPAAGINEDGRLEIFARSSGNTLFHRWQISLPFDNLGWSSWESLGGDVIGTPAVVSTGAGRLYAFARDSRGDYQFVAQTVPTGSAGWTGWNNLGTSGTMVSDPAAGRNRDGRLVVFARTSGNRLVFRSHQTAESAMVPYPPFNVWREIPGASMAGKPVVVTLPDGPLEIYVRWTDNTIRYTTQTVRNSENWTAWRSLSGDAVGDPAVGINQDGTLEVFARGPDNTIWTVKQPAPGLWP